MHQQLVQDFCLKHHLNYSAETRLLDTLSELGEVAKELLQGSNYGKTSYHRRPELEAELGDLYFAMLTLANSLDLDLETALTETLQKYKHRLVKGSAGSESDQYER